MRIPFVIEDAEYRGPVRLGGSFDGDDGVSVSYTGKHRFEYDDADGVLQEVELSEAQCDRAQPPFDVTTVKRGDLFAIRGVFVVKDGYPVVQEVRPKEAKVTKVA